MTKTKTCAGAWRATASALNRDQTTNKRPCVRRKVNKKKTRSGRRCSAANILLSVSRWQMKKEGKRVPICSPAHVNVIKHDKHRLRYPISHFDFSGGQMRNSLQHMWNLLSFFSAAQWQNCAPYALKIPLLSHLTWFIELESLRSSLY